MKVPDTALMNARLQTYLDTTVGILRLTLDKDGRVTEQAQCSRCADTTPRCACLNPTVSTQETMQNTTDET